MYIVDPDERLDEISEAIHYPECWDTMAYPTLLDAIKEFVCHEDDCAHSIDVNQ